jgi:type IX secretion system PorP/SprF family membrane protein
VSFNERLNLYLTILEMKNLYSFKSKFFSLIAMVLLVTNLASAQQEAMYSQYMFNTMAINPAYAGSRDVLSLTAVGRYQWIGVPGAPTTYSFTMDMPIKNEKMGIGLAAFSDGLGLAQNTGVSLAYSYKVRLGQKTTLSMGVSPSITNVTWNLSDVKNINEVDEIFSGQYDINRLFPNVGAGVFISNDRSYLGISVPQIIQTNLNSFQNTDTDSRIKRHYYTMMGFVIGSGNVKIKPSMMVRYTQGAPMGIDGNMNIWFKDKVSFGISGRKSQAILSGVDFMDAAVGMIELQLTPQLRFGYAYDVNLNRLNNPNRTGIANQLTGTPTHEGLLRYEFGYEKNNIITPRYF